MSEQQMTGVTKDMSPFVMLTLPDRETMLARLASMVDDNSHLREHFYPLLMKDAGQDVAASVVVLTITFAIAAYIAGNFPETSDGVRATPSKMLDQKTNQIIEAMVPDATMASHVKALFAEC
ncbi:hypothetical protein KBD34_04380 [Patescibacteria group bacterium]|nr:hypothetical protein [Patescibacteria group bacterium]